MMDDWISVKDRMPEKNGEVIAYNDEKKECIADQYRIVKASFYRHTSHVSWRVESSYSRTLDDVTHWMPLPNAPGSLAIGEDDE